MKKLDNVHFYKKTHYIQLYKHSISSILRISKYSSIKVIDLFFNNSYVILTKTKKYIYNKF